MKQKGQADMDEPIGTLEEGNCKAEIFSTDLPGQFTIRYRREDGSIVGEQSLSGLSSYRQREDEIRKQLNNVCMGKPIDDAALSDSGEY
jgi:hypothetical protein